MTDLARLFCNVGLSEQKAKETLKNKAVSSTFQEAISKVGECSMNVSYSIYMPSMLLFPIAK